MANYVALNRPKMESDIAVSGLKVVAVPKMSFKVDVTIDDKIFGKIKDDGILLEDMNKAAQKVYEQVCSGIKGRMTAFDKLFQGMIDKNAPKGEIEKNLAGLNKALDQDRSVGIEGAKFAVQQCWDNYLKKKKEYTKYKIKIGVTIFGAAAGLIVSISLMATSAFTGGAGAAFGIIGMFKSAMTIAKEITSAWMDIETAQKMLAKQLDIVEKAADGLAKRKANEYTAMVIDSFLGISQPCIKTCVSQLDTIEKKLLGVEIKCHEAAKLLNKILDEQEKLRKDFLKDATARLDKHPSPKAPGQLKQIEKKLDDALAPNYEAVMVQQAVINSLLDQFRTAEKTTEELKKRVAPLEKLSTIDEKIVRNILTLVQIPLGALSGNGLAAGQSLAEGLGSAASSFSYDKITGKVLDGSFLA